MANKKIANQIYLIAHENDQQAFEAFFQDYFTALVSYGNSIVKNHQAVEDIVIDIFVKLWENRIMLPAINNIANYIYTATKNACLNYNKNKSNQSQELVGETIIFAESNPESSLVNTENVNDIIRLINDLPHRCRLIFKLVKDENMSYAEVAELLNISVRTVNAQMSIAIARIVDGLQKSMPELNSYYMKKVNNSK